MWPAVTNLGDSAVLLPLAAMLFAWLWVEEASQLARRWLFTFGLVGALVAVSKLAFMLWCVGIPGLSFRGFSGHTALATVSYPFFLVLMLAPMSRCATGALAAMGLLLGAVIGWSRLEVLAHTPSEVVLGFLLGAAAFGWFFRGQALPTFRAPWGRLAVLAGYLLCFQLGRAPTQALLVALTQELTSRGY